MRIQVYPGDIETSGQVAQQVADTTAQVRGQLAGGAGGESGCDPSVHGAFAAMQQAWMAQAQYIGQCTGGLAAALGYASYAYPVNDQSQMRLVWSHP